MRILLIDDNKNLCFLTKVALTKYGHEVFASYDVSTGIVLGHECKPNLILMDVMMPDIGGVEAAKMFQEDKKLQHVPIVFLTALVTEEESGVEDMGLKVGDMNYEILGKPYEIKQLLNVIQKYVKK